MGEMADWQLEQMVGEECEYCGAEFPDLCREDCPTNYDEFGLPKENKPSDS